LRTRQEIADRVGDEGLIAFLAAPAAVFES
jgi:hypothetical protein